MKEVIELLLEKQATLEADKAAEKALACEKIDADYAKRADKISALLEMAGYVPPVEEKADEVDEVPAELEEVQADEVAETVESEEAQPVQVVY